MPVIDFSSALPSHVPCCYIIIKSNQIESRSHYEDNYIQQHQLAKSITKDIINQEQAVK